MNRHSSSLAACALSGLLATLVSATSATGCTAQVTVLSATDGGTPEAGAADGGTTADSSAAAGPAAGDAAGEGGATTGEPSQACDWSGSVYRPLTTPCKNVCLTEYPRSGAPRVLADDHDLPYRFHTVVGMDEATVYVYVYNLARPGGGTGYGLAAFPVAGGAPRMLLEFGTESSILTEVVDGRLLVAYSERLGSASMTTLYSADALTVPKLDASTALATFATPSPPREILVKGGHVYVSSPGSTSVVVDRVALVGGSAERVLDAPDVVAFTTGPSQTLYWLEGDTQQQPSGGTLGTRVKRRALPAGPAEEIARVELAGAIATRESHGGLIVMSAQKIYEMGLDGANVRVRYQGTSFPQHSGNLFPRHLHVDPATDIAYFGEICHPDADAPGYGVRAFHLGGTSVEWLDRDPRFPWHPENWFFEAGRAGKFRTTARGTYGLALR